jgi:hypothetical protein
MHVASGLYLTGAYAVQSYNGTSPGERCGFVFAPAGCNALTQNREDSTFWYLQGGISQNWTGLGRTVLYGEYGQFNDGANGLFTAAAPAGDTLWDTQVTFWGIGIVQHVDAAAMELYLAYRQYGASLQSGPGFGLQTGDLDDLSIVMGGARVRF